MVPFVNSHNSQSPTACLSFLVFRKQKWTCGASLTDNGDKDVSLQHPSLFLLVIHTFVSAIKHNTATALIILFPQTCSLYLLGHIFWLRINILARNNTAFFLSNCHHSGFYENAFPFKGKVSTWTNIGLFCSIWWNLTKDNNFKNWITYCFWPTHTIVRFTIQSKAWHHCTTSYEIMHCSVNRLPNLINNDWTSALYVFNSRYISIKWQAIRFPHKLMFWKIGKNKSECLIECNIPRPPLAI